MLGIVRKSILAKQKKMFFFLYLNFNNLHRFFQKQQKKNSAGFGKWKNGGEKKFCCFWKNGGEFFSSNSAVFGKTVEKKN